MAVFGHKAGVLDEFVQMTMATSAQLLERYKFTDESVRKLLRDSDFEIEKTWKDEREYFAVVLARTRRGGK